MLDPKDILSIFSTLLQVNAAFLGVVVTLVALVPALVEMVRSRYPNFLSSEVTRRRLNRGLASLSITIWLFGSATFLSIVGLLTLYTVLVDLVLLISSLVIGIILWASSDLAAVARSVI